MGLAYHLKKDTYKNKVLIYRSKLRFVDSHQIQKFVCGRNTEEDRKRWPQRNLEERD